MTTPQLNIPQPLQISRYVAAIFATFNMIGLISSDGFTKLDLKAEEFSRISIGSSFEFLVRCDRHAHHQPHSWKLIFMVVERPAAVTRKSLQCSLKILINVESEPHVKMR